MESVTSSLISKISSSLSKESSYLWGPSVELRKTCEMMETIRTVLIDAEKRSQQSVAVTNWIQRLQDLMYTVDDLIDEALTRQLMMNEAGIGRKVLSYFGSNSYVFTHRTLIRALKDVRKKLDDLGQDALAFGFARSYDEPEFFNRRSRVVTGSFLDQNSVVGRTHDMKAILGFLFDESAEDVSTIAIVGIGGMGKSVLAQLVYNNDEVRMNFRSRWWVCVSSMSDEAEIYRSILESITGSSCRSLTLSQMLRDIRESISTAEKFLLVIDDMALEACSIWQQLRSVLTCDSQRGSKVIVTARSFAIKADRVHNLEGLSSEESWALFKGLAFTREQENDPSWNILGKKILNKCANAPLAIRVVASLLSTKPTKEEWRSILDSQAVDDGDGSIMKILELSYVNLPRNLKLCFSYCSLFPKDYEYHKDDLIRLWTAQGYVIPGIDGTYEEVGHANLKELLRHSFFQDEKTGEDGEAISYKMHDLIHDLAVYVAKGEIIALTEGSNQLDQPIRHCSVGYKIDSSWEIPPSLLARAVPRSFLFICGGLLRPLVLEQLLTRFKLLRALDLQRLNIEEVPSSIGKLLHLRYLNLSGNKFRKLPKSLTKLLNLITLDISWCVQLEVLPFSFAELINLRHLDNRNCDALKYMPPNLMNLASLQHLSCFKVGKVISKVKSSGLDSLRGLKLRGQLQIRFENGIDNWNEDEMWKLPTTVQVLQICSYPGTRIPQWEHSRVDLPSLLPKLVKVHISDSSTVKHLPSFRHLPYLKALYLSSLSELTYIEEAEDKHETEHCDQSTVGECKSSFPCLVELELIELPRLLGWSRDVERGTTSEFLAAEDSDQMDSFPNLSMLKIRNCPMLKSAPPFPHLRTLELERIGEELIQHVLSTCFHSLETVAIRRCPSLNVFLGEKLTSLRRLELSCCNEVESLHFPLHNVLEELVIKQCPLLRLWESKKGGVDWDSLINLRVLSLDRSPDAERLPVGLSQRTALGKLHINVSKDNSFPDWQISLRP